MAKRKIVGATLDTIGAYSLDGGLYGGDLIAWGTVNLASDSYGGTATVESGDTLYVNGTSSYGNSGSATVNSGGAFVAQGTNSSNTVNVTLNGGGSGSNTLSVYSGGQNTLYGAGMMNMLYVYGAPNGGTNTLYGGSGYNLLQDSNNGASTTDVLYGGTSSNYLYGGSGTNTLYDGGGYNVVDGGSGSSFLYADGGQNTLYDQRGHNTLSVAAGAGGSNTLIGTGGGHNLFSIGSGAVVFSLEGPGFGQDYPLYEDYQLTNQTGLPQTLSINADDAGNVTFGLGGNNTFVGYAAPLYVANSDQLSIVMDGPGNQTIDGPLTLGPATTINAGTLTVTDVTGNGSASEQLLSIDNAALSFGLNATTAGELVDTAAASVSGVNTINIAPVGTSLTTGNYTLISAASGLTGDFAFANGATAEAVTVGNQSYALILQNTDTAETLTVVNAVYWTGATNGNWDTSTANWANVSGGTTSTTYSAGEAVVFDDNATTADVTVAANVAPAAITFNNSAQSYTVSNNSSVAISEASPGMYDLGGGSVTVTGANSLSGLTSVTSGSTLQLGDGTTNGAVGGNIDDEGTLEFANGTAQTYTGVISGAGDVSISGPAALTLSGTNTLSGQTTIDAGATLAAGADNCLSPNSAIDVDGTLDLHGYGEAIPSLTGAGIVTNNSMLSSATSTLTVGGDDSSTTFSGTISDGAAAGGMTIVKAGAGTMTLSGNSTLTGGVTIAAGEVDVNGSIQSPVTVGSGATPGGSGSTGPVTSLGGAYNATLYKLQILDSVLEDWNGNHDSNVTLALVPNPEILALSAVNAASEGFQVSGSSDYFKYNPNYSSGSYTGPALVDMGTGSGAGSGAGSGSMVGYYFKASVSEDDADPKAVADYKVTGVNESTTINVLANDTDPASGGLTIASHTGPSHGSVVLNSDGTFTYTPAANYFGDDTFTYVAADGTNTSNRGKVTIDAPLPTICLLDDANNDGTINSADEPVKDTGTGRVVLVSDPSSPPIADSIHLAEVDLSLAFSQSIAALPENLSGWTLTLTAGDHGAYTRIWDSMSAPNELDLNSSNQPTGTVSWQLNSNGAGFPSSVYVDTTAAAVVGLQLQLTAPSGTTPVATSEIRIAGLEGYLTAKTMDQSSGTADASKVLPSDIQHSTGAVIPVDNVDQNYYDNFHLVHGEAEYYTDLDIPNGVANDRYLLPVVITGQPGYTYSLDVPEDFGDDLAVWGTDNRTDPIAFDSTFTLDNSGSKTVYIQATDVGTETISLVWHAGRAESTIDTLNVDTFAFSGPANVPNYSTYSYGTEGAPNYGWPARVQWTLPNGSDASLSSRFGLQTTIQWGSGGTSQRFVNFWATQYYNWSYFVNVVEISFGQPSDGDGNQMIPFQTNQATTQLCNRSHPGVRNWSSRSGRNWRHNGHVVAANHRRATGRLAA